MRTLIGESASAPLGTSVTPSESRSEAEPVAMLIRGEVSALQAMTWLTVGLGVLVTGLAVALTALAIFQ